MSWTSDMILSLSGGNGGFLEAMDGRDSGVLEEGIWKFLSEALGGGGEEGEVREDVTVTGAGVTGQTPARRWRLTREENGTRRPPGRRLPTASSSLDVSMTITGEYRPPPYLDLDHLVSSSINRASSAVVADLRRRGSLVGSTYFERVADLTAAPAKDVTARPTPRPSPSPTIAPTEVPTLEPTASPTRGWVQSLTTAEIPSDDDDDKEEEDHWWERTSRSYGILFRVRTTSRAAAVRILGMDIYASSPNEELHYEIWTKEGSWRGYQGNITAFEKIAEGIVVSKGECLSNEAANEASTTTRMRCELTSLPWEEFEAVSVSGGGGSRSFYVTLHSNVLVYGRPETAAVEEDADGPVMAVMERHSTPELEIYQGTGVLTYPFEEATDGTLHYRSPRLFLGRIHYDRMPCDEEREDGDANGNYQYGPCEARAQGGEGADQHETEQEDEMAFIVPTAVPSVVGGGGEDTWTDVAVDADGDVDIDADPQTNATMAVPSNRPAKTPSSEEAYESSFANSGEDDDSEETIEIESNAGDETVENTPMALVKDDDVEDVAEPSQQEDDDEEAEYDNDAWENINMIDDDVGDATNAKNNSIVYTPNDDIAAPATVEDYDTYDPKGLLQTNFILSLQNVPEIVMNDREVAKYQQLLLDYLLKQPTLSAVKVDVLSVEVWHQELPRLNELAKVKETTNVYSNTKYRTKARKLQNVVDNVSYSSAAFDKRRPNNPSRIDVDVTTIVRSSNANLPPDAASILILNSIASADSTFVDDLRDVRVFYTYFQNIDGIAVKLIEEATVPPTLTPTAYEDILSWQAVENGPRGRRVLAATGLGIAALWCFLTLCSLSYLRNARKQMKNDKMLNRLYLTKRDIKERGEHCFSTMSSSSDEWEENRGCTLSEFDFAPSEMAVQHLMISQPTNGVYGHSDDRRNRDVESGALGFNDNSEDTGSGSGGDSDSTDSDSSGDDSERSKDHGVIISDGVKKGRTRVSVLLDKKMEEKQGKTVQKQSSFKLGIPQGSRKAKTGQARRMETSSNSSSKSSTTRSGFPSHKMSSRSLGKDYEKAKLGTKTGGDPLEFMALKVGDRKHAQSSKRKLASENNEQDDIIRGEVTHGVERPLLPQSQESSEDETKPSRTSFAHAKSKSHGVLPTSLQKDFPQDSKQTRRKSEDNCNKISESSIATSSKLTKCRKSRDALDSTLTDDRKYRRKNSCESAGDSATTTSSFTNGGDSKRVHHGNFAATKSREMTSNPKHRRKSSTDNAKNDETLSSSTTLESSSGSSPDTAIDSKHQRRSSSDNFKGGEAASASKAGRSGLRGSHRVSTASYSPDYVFDPKHCRRSSFDDVSSVQLADSVRISKLQRRNSSGNFEVRYDARRANGTLSSSLSHVYGKDPKHLRRSSSSKAKVNDEIDSILGALADSGSNTRGVRAAAASSHSPDSAMYSKDRRRSSSGTLKGKADSTEPHKKTAHRGVVSTHSPDFVRDSKSRRRSSSDNVKINEEIDSILGALADPRKKYISR